MSAADSAVGRAVAVRAAGLHVVYRIGGGGLPLRRRTASRQVHALRGVDLTVHQGESVGVVGRNGSGKSTLMRALAGLVEPAEGEVLARSNPVLLGVGAVLNNELSGRDNALLGGTALGLSRAEARARVDEVIAFAEVERFAHLPLKAYSSGMRARLQFAVAAAVRPEILIVDETLAVGDAEFRARSRRRIAELVQGAGAVLFVSHSMGLVREICERVVWLDAGTVVADGPPDDVVRAYTAAVASAQEGA